MKPTLPNSLMKILSISLSLSVFLALIRAYIIGFRWRFSWAVLTLLPRMFLAAYYDLSFVAVITLLFLGSLLLIRNHQKTQRLLCFIYADIALLALILALINIIALQMLGGPFNYQWLYYSDLLKRLDLYVALSIVSWKLVATGILLTLAMLIVARLLNYGINLLQKKYGLGRVLLIPILGSILYFPLAHWYTSKLYLKSSKLENPVISFLKSIRTSRESLKLFSMETPTSYEDFQGGAGGPSKNLSISGSTGTGVKNVVIFVFESVPAEYIEAYDGAYPVTSELNKHLKHSAVFKNIYAHAPASNKSLVSIMLSIYPWISYRSVTNEYPGIKFPSLSGELKGAGYRTAFFHSGDNRFQRGDEFLSHRQFDKREDYQNLPCERETFKGTKKGTFMDGFDDECMVDSFNRWIGEKSEQPFFAVLWTMMTHYPYFVAGEEIDFGVNDEKFNRYLNALHHGDKVLGKLLHMLEKLNLKESTLVVVVGDHGEAFGRHNQTIHASNIYEENLHVPLILINQSLFKGEEYTTVGGLVDLAPTIMNILDLPSPAEWQGRSLFSNNRSGRVYFFAPWADYLLGFREENLKLIYNATKNSNEVYDLLVDPNETNNLANQFPRFISVGHQRLATWVQYQDKFMKELFPNSP